MSPPKNRVNLPYHAATRWRLLVEKAKGPTRTIRVSDADRVLLIHLEEVIDSLCLLGDACIAVAFNTRNLPQEVIDATPQLYEVFTAYSDFLRVRKSLEAIDPDMKVW